MSFASPVGWRVKCHESAAGTADCGATTRSSLNAVKTKQGTDIMSALTKVGTWWFDFARDTALLSET